MGLQGFPIPRFAGLNTRDPATELQPDEAQKLLNMTLAPVAGAISQRRGKVQFDTSGFPAAKRAEYVRPWYFGSTKLLMLSIDGDVYSSTVGGALTQRKDGTAGTVWAMEQAEDSTGADRLWMMNGSDAPQKWDGSAGSTSAWANSPPNGTMLRVWKNRMCIAGVPGHPQRLFLSDIGNPESPATTYGTNWVDIKGTEDDLDAITWIEPYGDRLIVFKKNSVWAVHSSNPPWDNIRLAGNIGCEGRFMSAVVLEKLYFFSDNGVWSLDPADRFTEETWDIRPTLVSRLNYPVLSKVRLCGSPDHRVLAALPLDSGSGNTYMVEIYPDFHTVDNQGGTKPAVSLHNFAASSICKFRPGNQDVVIGGSADSAKVHTLFSGSNDDGAAIESYWQTGWRPILSEEPFERLRRVNLEMSGHLSVEVYQDFSESAKFSQVLETAVDPDPFWTGGIWDGGTWDPVVTIALKRVRPEARGRYHSLRFSNSVKDKTFTLYVAELRFRGGKEH